jgi:hypothetical protein
MVGLASFASACWAQIPAPNGAGAGPGYRQIAAEDNIRLYTRVKGEMNFGGHSEQMGKQFGIVCKNGKEIDIPLVDTTVTDGNVVTKDYGTLKEESTAALSAKIFATEDTIRKLQALQATCQD